MADDKKILLYRIDEQDKNVIFVATADSEQVWENITEEMQTALAFDDIFRDITEFRDGFLDYEKLTDELIGAINGRGKVFREILERFDDMRLGSFNFFTRYYSDTLRDVFTKARADIDKANPLFNTKALKKSTEYVNDVFRNIREVVRDDHNFDFNAESDLKAFRLTFDKIIIRGNDRNDIYTVADTALTNFFYDFTAAIHKLKLYECDCKFCGKKYLGAKNSVCCDAEDCQTKYAHEKKNAKRRERDNGDYQVYLTRLSNYIGQKKIKLSASVNEDKTIIGKFDKERKVYVQKMKDKIEEYKAENRLPDDEMKEFYVKLTTKFNVFWMGLAAEWEKEHKG